MIGWFGECGCLCPTSGECGTGHPDSATAGSSGDASWSNIPNAVGAADSAFATVVLNNGEVSDELRLTDFDFAIDTGATIDGIEVVIITTGSDEPDAASDIRLTKNGATTVGTEPAPAGTWVSGTVTYGGPTELWGTTWTPLQLNASTFGLIVKLLSDTDGDEYKIDGVLITVYCTV